MKLRRYRVLDGIRGLALINMILYHTVWDLVYIFGADWKWYMSHGAYIWQQGICWTFIFLSGFCWNIGRHPIKRGITVFLGGAVISAVTIIIVPQNRVLFGILTFIGSCMIFMVPLDKFLRKINNALGMLGSALLFAATRGVNQGYIGFEGFEILKIPKILYKNVLTTYIGFPQDGFYSTDYFSLLPWIFLFISGYFLYNIVNSKNGLANLEKGTLPMLEWFGRRSLWIYMIHQPVIYLALNIMYVLKTAV